jgi:hypothetical protein
MQLLAGNFCWGADLKFHYGVRTQHLYDPTLGVNPVGLKEVCGATQRMLLVIKQLFVPSIDLEEVAGIYKALYDSYHIVV